MDLFLLHAQPISTHKDYTIQPLRNEHKITTMGFQTNREGAALEEGATLRRRHAANCARQNCHASSALLVIVLGMTARKLHSRRFAEVCCTDERCRKETAA